MTSGHAPAAGLTALCLLLPATPAATAPDIAIASLVNGRYRTGKFTPLEVRRDPYGFVEVFVERDP